MRDLFIVGAGGFGREAVWTVERINSAAKQPLLFISIASFISSSLYLCVMRSVIGKPRSCDSLRKSKLCTQSLD